MSTCVEDDDPIPCDTCEFRGVCRYGELACYRYFGWINGGRDDPNLIQMPSKKIYEGIFVEGATRVYLKKNAYLS